MGIREPWELAIEDGVITGIGSAGGGGIHDDTDHSGSAKRNGANGVAGINAASKVPDAILEKPVGTHEADTSTHGVATVADAADLTTHEADTTNIHGIANTANLSLSGHTHTEANITDLDHDATKIKGMTVDTPGAADDNKVLTYDHTNTKFKLAAGGSGGDCYIASGSYTGDGTVNRAIAHGLGVKPKLVIINNVEYSGGKIVGSTIKDDKLIYINQLGYTVTSKDATNFYVGSGTGSDLYYSCNVANQDHYWVAFG